MLLAPYGRLAVLDYLALQYALHTLVESLDGLLAQRLVGQLAIEGSLLQIDVAQHFHGVDHGIIVEGDMNLIATHPGPELWPSAIVVLSAQQVFHTLAESLTILLALGGLIEPSQIRHLHIGGIVVGGRVVSPAFVIEYLLPLLMSHGLCHVDVLWPSACHSLVVENLVADESGLLCFEKLLFSFPHRIVPALGMGWQEGQRHQDRKIKCFHIIIVYV